MGWNHQLGSLRESHWNPWQPLFESLDLTALKTLLSMCCHATYTYFIKIDYSAYSSRHVMFCSNKNVLWTKIRHKIHDKPILGFFKTAVDGSEIRRSPVEVGSWNPFLYEGFSTIQPVVGLGISEPSTVVLFSFGSALGPGPCLISLLKLFVVTCWITLLPNVWSSWASTWPIPSWPSGSCVARRWSFRFRRAVGFFGPFWSGK